MVILVEAGFRLISCFSFFLPIFFIRVAESSPVPLVLIYAHFRFAFDYIFGCVFGAYFDSVIRDVGYFAEWLFYRRGWCFMGGTSGCQVLFLALYIAHSAFLLCLLGWLGRRPFVYCPSSAFASRVGRGWLGVVARVGGGRSLQQVQLVGQTTIVHRGGNVSGHRTLIITRRVSILVHGVCLTGIDFCCAGRSKDVHRTMKALAKCRRYFRHPCAPQPRGAFIICCSLRTGN